MTDHPGSEDREGTGACRSVHVRITGRVQGVGYRAWTAAQAREHGLSGFVCNRRDGSVEAVFQGAEKRVEAMLAACSRGPRHAEVEAVEILAETAERFEGFAVRPTA